MRIHDLSALALAGLMVGALVHAQAPQSGSPRQQSTTKTQQQDRQGSGEALNARLKQREPAAQVRGKRPVQMALVTSASRIASAPAQFYGVPVSVHAQVARSYNPHVFTLEEDSWWRLGDNVLVLVPSPRPGATLDTNDFVTVVGTVRPFVRAEIERDYDWFDFDALPDINVELAGRPVIIADMARTSDGETLMQAAQPRSRILVADAGDIADVPRRFYGHAVSVAGNVADVWSPRVFTLDEDEWFAGPDVLVFNPHPMPGAGDLGGDPVRVLGTVRPFVVAEFEADYDWFDAADYKSLDLESMNQRPVIVASSIRGAQDREMVQFQPDLAIDVAEAELAPRMEEWARAAQGNRGRTPATRDERGTTGQHPAPAPRP